MELKIGDITLQIKSWDVNGEKMNRYFIKTSSYKPLKIESETECKFINNRIDYDKRYCIELNKEESKEYERLQKEFPPGTRVISTSGIEMTVSCILYNFKNFMVSGNYTFPVSNVTKVEKNMDNKHDFKAGDVVRYIGDTNRYLTKNATYNIEETMFYSEGIMIHQNWFCSKFFNHISGYVIFKDNSVRLIPWVVYKFEKETNKSFWINGKEYKKKFYQVLSEKESEEYEKVCKEFSIGSFVKHKECDVKFKVEYIQFDSGIFFIKGGKYTFNIQEVRIVKENEIQDLPVQSSDGVYKYFFSAQEIGENTNNYIFHNVQNRLDYFYFNGFVGTSYKLISSNGTPGILVTFQKVR